MNKETFVKCIDAIKAHDAEGVEIPLSNAGELYDLLKGQRNG